MSPEQWGRIKDLPPGEPGRSGWAGRFLAENGFEAVYNVQEGVLGRGGGIGWARRGLPMRGCRVCAAE